MRRRGRSLALLLLLSCEVSLASTAGRAQSPAVQLNTLQEMYTRLGRCWRPPSLPEGDLGMQVTVLVSFKRNGEILGKPRITFESTGATDDDRYAYRIAVMETLQRCTPLPFTEGLGGAIAGRPLTLRFDDRRNPPKPREKNAWLTTTTL